MYCTVNGSLLDSGRFRVQLFAWEGRVRRHQGLLLGIWKTGKYFLDYSLLSDEEVLEGVRSVVQSSRDGDRREDEKLWAHPGKTTDRLRWYGATLLEGTSGSGGHWQGTQQKNSWTPDEDGYPPGAPGTAWVLLTAT